MGDAREDAAAMDDETLAATAQVTAKLLLAYGDPNPEAVAALLEELASRLETE